MRRLAYASKNGHPRVYKCGVHSRVAKVVCWPSWIADLACYNWNSAAALDESISIDSIGLMGLNEGP